MLPSTDLNNESHVYQATDNGTLGGQKVKIGIDDLIGSNKMEPSYESDFSLNSEPDLDGRYSGNFEIDINKINYNLFDSVCIL